MKNYIYICDTLKAIEHIVKGMDASHEQTVLSQLIEEAKLQGSSMEDRLLKYRDAIEKLGFQRIQ